MKTQKKGSKLEIQQGKRPFYVHGHPTETIHRKWDKQIN